MLSGAEAFKVWQLEFYHFIFNVFQELFPAMRFNLFGPNPGPKRLKRIAGLRMRFQERRLGKWKIP